MNKIRKRQDNRFEIRFNFNGKRKSIYGKTKNECYVKYKNFRKENKQVKTKQQTITLYNFSLEWLNRFKKDSVAENTFLMYENIVKKHFVNLTNDIKKYTTSQLQDFLNSLGKTRTKEIAFQTLKQIFKKAQELEIIDKDISKFLIKGKIDKNDKTSFTIEEQKNILANLKDNTISKYILAYLMLGARLSELKSIKKENIKKNYVLIKGTKTKNAERWIKISDKYQSILLNYDEPIFNCMPGTIKAKMREFFKKIGIKGSTHKLRHTFSTNLYYLGVDDNTRKQYLGHGSITVTNDIYTHLDPTISKDDILNLYKDLYPNF